MGIVAVFVRVSPEEREIIRRGAALDDRSVSSWARLVLLREARKNIKKKEGVK